MSPIVNYYAFPLVGEHVKYKIDGPMRVLKVATIDITLFALGISSTILFFGP